MQLINIYNQRFLLLFVFAMFTLTMQGCIVSGGGGKNFGSDQAGLNNSNASLLSNSSDSILQSDALIMQEVLSKPSLIMGENGQILWENSTTGSQGTISQIVENKVNGQMCRNFQTLRTAFDGVSLYNGQICQNTKEEWAFTQFSLIE